MSTSTGNLENSISGHSQKGLASPKHMPLPQSDVDRVALALRLGLGSVFVIGGWWKFSRAVNATTSDALVARYMAADGYINSFFAQYLFEGLIGTFLSPLGFLTLLSGFELLSGLALLAGLAVRPLSLIWGFLLWSFVIALPVVTSTAAAVEGRTYLSPAIIVQIRDIGLSGMFFALFNLGSGVWAADARIFARGAPARIVNWNAYGLLLRLSLAVVLLVGGFFAGLDHVKSWVALPWLLIIAGVLLASGYLTRLAAAATLAILLWYIGSKLSFDTSVWNNLNAIKREIAFVAASAVLTRYAGGAWFRVDRLLPDPMTHLFGRQPSSS